MVYSSHHGVYIAASTLGACMDTATVSHSPIFLLYGFNILRTRSLLQRLPCASKPPLSDQHIFDNTLRNPEATDNVKIGNML